MGAKCSRLAVSRRGERGVLPRLGRESDQGDSHERESSLVALKSFPADFYLLDSFSAGYGGSGQQFPWEWLDGIDRGKFILSGGLRVDNVAQAIEQIHPYGVDVCSGVEARPGVKDHGKLKEFIAAVKAA